MQNGEETRNSPRLHTRRALAYNSVYDLNKVYEKDFLKKKDQEKLCHQLFLGDKSKGILLSIDTFLANKKPFDRLFTKKNQTVVTDASINSLFYNFVLKPSLHNRDFSLIVGQDIKRKHLEFSTYSFQQIISSRTYMPLATEYLKNNQNSQCDRTYLSRQAR